MSRCVSIQPEATPGDHCAQFLSDAVPALLSNPIRLQGNVSERLGVYVPVRAFRPWEVDRMHTGRTLVAAAAIVVALVGASAPAWAAQDPQNMSVDSDEAPLRLDTRGGHLSDDGDKVALATFPDPADENAPSPVYLRDRSSGTTKLIYTSEPGHRIDVDLSGNGRYLAIRPKKEATTALLVRDASTTSTKWLAPSHGFTDISVPSISDDGTKVAFTASKNTDPRSNAYLWNVITGGLTQVTNGSGVADAVISGDGRKVAYSYRGHAYARTVASRATVLADSRPDGQPGNAANAIPRAFSDNGAYLLLTSGATDMAPGTTACKSSAEGCAFRRNLSLASPVVASTLPNGAVTPIVWHADLSGDARVVAYGAIADFTHQVYVRRMSTGATRKASVNAVGGSADPSATDPHLAQSGSTITFTSLGRNFGTSPTGSTYRIWLTPAGV